MHVSINSTDNTLVLDGVGMRTDCANLRADHISAVQWYGDKGEVEYFRHAQPNELIDDFAPYQQYVANARPFPEPEPLTPEQFERLQIEFRDRHPDFKKRWEADQAKRKALTEAAINKQQQWLHQLSKSEKHRR